MDLSRWLLLSLVLLAVGVATVSNVPALAQDDSGIERPEDAEMPPNTTTTTETSVRTATMETRTYTVVGTGPIGDNVSTLAQYGAVKTHSGHLAEIEMPPRHRQNVSRLPWVESVSRVREPVSPAVAGSGNASSLGVERLHQRGITGTDVRVGIIDAGFDPAAANISDAVGGTRRFSEPVSTEHGTAVAEIVSQTAPDASLYLATATTPTNVSASLEYFAARDVDVVVMSAAYPSLNDDGEHILAQPIADAQSDGILYVNSAGNFRLQHWEGSFVDTDGDDYHEFTPGDERQCIPSCTVLAQPGRFRAVLDWEREGDGSEYQIGLYDPSVGDQDEIFATSVPAFETADDNRQFMATQLSQRPVDLVIKNTAGPGNDELELYLYDTQMEDPVGRSSIGAPADVAAATSVAAYDRTNQQTAAYSSLGPTDDGRLAPTVTGYTNIGVSGGTFAGTSASAPYVAGVAALVEGATAEDRSPRQLNSVLVETADDIGDPGEDVTSGAGVVNASAAVAASTPRQLAVDAGVNRTVSSGETVTLNTTELTRSTEENLQYSWEQLSGPSVSLTNSTAATPSFVAPSVNSETALKFRVTVRDVTTDVTSTDTVTISVTPVQTSPNGSIADYRTGEGAVEIQGLRKGIDGFVSGKIDITLLRQIITEFTS
jgi:hypothetical protein